MHQPPTPAAERRTARQIAEEEGIDVSLIEDALLKTPEERLRDNSRVLATVEALRRALEQPHAGT